MRKIIRSIELVGLIIRKGKFRHTGVDHSKKRSEVLKGLAEFSPDGSTKSYSKSRMTKFADCHPFLKSVLGELAFIKQTLESAGGHLTLPQRNLCYVRIPKAASTAYSSAILLARFPALRTQALSPEKINYLVDVNLQKAITTKEKSAAFFTVVRNPFARIVSVYREFFENRPKDFIYEDYLFGILRNTTSFHDFVKRVRLIPDRLKDRHLMPQCLFLGFYERNNVPVKVFRLEEPIVWKNFLSHYSLDIEPVNVSAHYDYRLYFDAETLQVVYDLYSRDISFFGYEPAYQYLKDMVEADPKQHR